LIFDLDGTLIDSQQDLTIAVNATRFEAGLGPLEPREVAALVGEGAATLVRRAVPTDDEVRFSHSLEFFVRFYRRHSLEHTKLYPGTSEAIERMHTAGFTLGILTNKPVRISRDILAALNLAAKFQFIYGTRGPLPGPPHPEGTVSFDQKKPNPVGILTMLKHTGLPPSEAMIVGDSSVDVITGRNAGIWTCGVSYGFQPESFAEHPPDWMVDSLDELAGRLDSQ
jgi:phosphoglycolate phosphatase